jgi:hypothetical protein
MTKDARTSTKRINNQVGNHCDLYRDLYRKEVIKNIKLGNELIAANERIMELLKERPKWIMKNT